MGIQGFSIPKCGTTEVLKLWLLMILASMPWHPVGCGMLYVHMNERCWMMDDGCCWMMDVVG